MNELFVFFICYCSQLIIAVLSPKQAKYHHLQKWLWGQWILTMNPTNQRSFLVPTTPISTKKRLETLRKKQPPCLPKLDLPLLARRLVHPAPRRRTRHQTMLFSNLLSSWPRPRWVVALCSPTAAQKWCPSAGLGTKMQLYLSSTYLFPSSTTGTAKFWIVEPHIHPLGA